MHDDDDDEHGDNDDDNDEDDDDDNYIEDGDNDDDLREMLYAEQFCIPRAPQYDNCTIKLKYAYPYITLLNSSVRIPVQYAYQYNARHLQ